MLDLLRAERIKLLRHRATWFLVWIFPIGVTAVLAGITLHDLTRAATPEAGPPETAAGWIADAVFPWQFPANTLGRYLLGAFTAVAFGGEYGWNTWKLVAPHRDRTALMLAKYVGVITLIVLGLVLMQVLATVGLVLNDVLTNDPIPAGVQPAVLLAENGRAATAAFLTVLLTIAYASAGAVLTRSTLAGAILAIVAITAETIVLQVGPRYLDPTLYQALPGYHLANLGGWLTDGEPVSQKFVKGGVVSLHWGWSLSSYLIWTCGLAGLAVAAFRRQDLN